MMIALLDPAQIERIRGLVGHQQPEAIDIEGLAAGKVADTELDMARAHDVERRVEDRRPDGHWMSPCPGCGAARSGAPLIRDLAPDGSRVCSASLRAALRPGNAVTPPAPWPSSSRGYCCCECGIRGRFPEPRPKARAGSWRRRFPGVWRRRRIPSRQPSGGSPADARSRPGS